MDLLNAVKSFLADVLSVSPSPEERDTRTGNTSLIVRANQYVSANYGASVPIV